MVLNRIVPREDQAVWSIYIFAKIFITSQTGYNPGKLSSFTVGKLLAAFIKAMITYQVSDRFYIFVTLLVY